MSLYVSDVAEIGRILGDRKDAADRALLQWAILRQEQAAGRGTAAAQAITNVRRYQLGAPVWRALVGVMQIEPDGIRYVREGDKTAVFFDARIRRGVQRPAASAARGTCPKAEVVKAKDDGRLPMEDHNTRIIVFGERCRPGPGGSRGDGEERLPQRELLRWVAHRPETCEQLGPCCETILCRPGDTFHRSPASARSHLLRRCSGLHSPHEHG